jgi:carbamoyltransferase
MYILGIHYYGHNTSVALFKNNNLIFAIEEERLSRIKNDGNVPHLSIRCALKKFKLKINDIDLISFATIPERLIQKKYLKFTLDNYEKSKDIFFEEKSFKHLKFLNEFKKNFVKKYKYKNKVCFFNHHLCHLYASYYLSGFNKSICISVDGLGEMEATMIATIKNNKHKIIKTIDYPNSLGKVYEAITFYLGFNPFTSAGTVMALAALGNYNKKLNNKETYLDIFKKIIKNDREIIYKIDDSWFNYPFTRKGWVSQKFLRKFGKVRSPKSKTYSDHYKNIAAALQKRFEEVYLKIIRYGQKKTNLNNLTLSGGCALNCKANGKINNLKLNQVYIQPASGDAGLSIGAAKLGYETLNKNKKFSNKHFDTTYFGTSCKNSEIQKNAKKHGVNCKKLKNPEKLAAQLIFNKKIIGWVQGRSELGPRALGNRSILACPNSIEIKNKINMKIKKRQIFRPFAPSILKEEFNKYYISKYDSAFMLMALKTNKKYLEHIKGTVHYDYSARVQTVTKKTNKRYHKLISEYKKLSGIPALLNTSFNGKDVPIVNNAEDAIKEFKKIKLDALFIENYLITAR